ncbi:Na+/H+ antiporter NhaC [Alteromonas sp. 1_MG-2023]|uniref:Na+/H+ antiporter NhaC n=1 Tax=Alteromonas sp. 1_MG-2023 TaxID=3062669 RepID=UPI0026E3EF6D|nr:Na+/H+ antiporter NhaC [Alteromonas sp. 1_MG-2023]MDO6474479.1 Na+/H+ antiporter NhaC [Alteromonas sp. 1_MG-2023]
MQTVRQPSLLQVGLLAGVIILMIVVMTQYTPLPIQLALLGAWFATLGLGKWLGRSYESMQNGLLSGISQGMEAILVLIAVGALIGSWMAGGIVPSIIYYGLSVMTPQIFLFAAFFICAVTSLATGTSFGTIGTAGIAMMGIGEGFGLPAPLVAGAAISGAYVGDKLSPLSDTTVMTASLCRVDLIEHIKSMLYISVPAIVIASALFLFTGILTGHQGSTGRATEVMAVIDAWFTVSPFMILPALAVITLLILRQPAVPVIFFGALLGVVWAVLFQQQDVIPALETLYGGSHIESDDNVIAVLLNRGGMVSMLPNILLIILALGIGGLMEATGVLATITTSLQRWADNVTKLGLSTLLAGIIGNILGGAAYVSLITASTITGKNYDATGTDRRVLSRNAESGGTVVTPMIPWSDGGVFMATTLGVTTAAYLPYLWYHLLVLGIAVLYSFTGWFHFNNAIRPAKTFTNEQKTTES